MTPALTVLLLLLGLFFVLLLLFPKNPRPAFRYLGALILGGASVLVLLPFIWLLTAILKDRSVLNEHVFLPPLVEWSSRTLNFDNFRRLFEGRTTVTGTVYFWQHLLNSTFLATTCTTVQLFFASLAGYALAKYRFRGQALLMSYMLGSMMIPGVLLLAPVYELCTHLGLVDSLPGLVVPQMVTAYGIFLFRQACVGVPSEIIEAGRIDGASEFGIYFRLVMPLVRPMAAAFTLVSFLGNWNAFFAPNIFLHTESKLTLPVVLNLYVSQYENDYGVFLAGTALAMIPPAILFFALQREFISGLTSGAVKG